MKQVEIKIKKLHKDAVIPFKTFDSDFCFDVVATSCKEVAPNVYQYGIGLGFQIDRLESDVDLSEFKISMDFRPRSSIYKTGMILANCEPTIDESYTGEVLLNFYHVIPSLPRYLVGNKIAQLKLGLTHDLHFKVVPELDETDRGTKGLGSTGK